MGLEKETKMNKLQNLIDSLTTTKKFLIRKGYTFEDKKQLFIKPEHAAPLAMLISYDLGKRDTLQLHFTKGNKKLDAVPSVALSPWLTCNNKACYLCGSCYGLKQKYLSFFKFVYMVENTVLLNDRPEEFKKQVNAYLTLTGARFFRWFENGDFPSNESVKLFDDIARGNPRTDFLCMTKQYARVNAYLESNGGKYSENLKLRLSKFEIDGLTEIPNPFSLPTTDVINKAEELHAGATLCPGFSSDCAHCLKCWKCNREVDFIKH